MNIIDRIENGIAVIETDNGKVEVDVSLIEGLAREGDVILKKGSAFCIDREATDRRKRIISMLKKRINKDDNNA